MIWWLTAALAAPLSLPDVLSAVDVRHPKLEAAEAKLEAARAGVLAGRGAFDPVLKGKASTYGGKYERNVIDVGLTTRTLYGPDVTVGYTRGTGDIPEYAGDTKTGPSGELVGRLDVPVLKGLGVNKERVKLTTAQLKETATEALQQDAVRLVRWDASVAYWSWVAAGMSVEVVREQLDLANRRMVALERQVEEGSRSQLDLIDNQRVLAERTAKYAEAQGKLMKSAVKVSLYARADDGTPTTPSEDQLPDEWAPPSPVPDAERLAGALDRRPDLSVAQRVVEMADQNRRQAGNAVLPELTVTAIGIQPLDADTKQEVVAGVALKAPVAFRAGRGDRWQANAELAARRADQRMVADQIRAEVEMAVIHRRQAEERAVASRVGAERAAEVLRLERRRFELGGSDLFKLLQREDALAKARDAAVKSELSLRLADAEMTAVLGR